MSTQGTARVDTSPHTNNTQPFHSLPIVRITIAWALGLLLGSQLPHPAAWPIAATVALLFVCIALLTRRPRPFITALAMVCITLAAATWWQVRQTQPAHHISNYTTAHPRLVDMSGSITAEPRIHTPDDTDPAHQQPATVFTLRTHTLHTPSGDHPTSGLVDIYLPFADTRLKSHQHIRVQGFLRPLQHPANPGQPDYTTYKVRRGILASCTLHARTAWQHLDETSHLSPLTQRRDNWTQATHRSLQHGYTDTANPKAVALLDAILLGIRSSDLTEIYDAFRRTGIAHLLAISGLHVGVLAFGVWFLAALLIPNPRWALVTAGLVVGLYLLAVPWRIPIIRAGFITSAYCLLSATGRRPDPRALLALIALLLLVARPTDLFDAGFQLSFGIVAALICFTTPVSNYLWPQRLFQEHQTLFTRLRRTFADYLAVSIIAFLVAMPIIAYHFQMISPLAIAMSVLTFPLVAVVLWLGLAKIAIGTVSASLGSLLATPLLALASLFVRIVEAADRLGTAIDLPKPTPLWTVAALAIVIALLQGRFYKRTAALAACVALSTAWLVLPHTALLQPDPPALTARMLAVGAGSCYVIQSQDETWLFDCGSSSYPQIGSRTVAPALQALGITQIDTLVISHADTDHYSGVLELTDHIPAARIVTTQHMLDNDSRATQRLLAGLRDRDIPIQVITTGWQTQLAHAQVRAIWPPAQNNYKEDNDRSIVLAIDVAGRRLLLTGDIQQQAMTDMLAANLDLRADFTDLPHHGAFPPAAVDWLRAVQPAVVLQSCNLKRLQHDPWQDHLHNIDRYTTPQHGMVTLQIMHDGKFDLTGFRKPLIAK